MSDGIAMRFINYKNSNFIVNFCKFNILHQEKVLAHCASADGFF